MKDFVRCETDFADEEDELFEYLEKEADKYYFDELSEDFISAADTDFMSGVPVPFLKGQIIELAKGEGLKISEIADNLAAVCGINPNFKYAEAYIRFLRMCYEDKLIQILVSLGAQRGAEGKFKESIIYYRAAKFAEPGDMDTILGYAVSCRGWFSELDAEESEELMWILKSEAKAAFEEVHRLDPNQPDVLYFLGYIYFNEGEYSKAMAFWRSFLKEADLSESEAVRNAVSEIAERVEELKDPVKIEAGINAAATGRYSEALKMLEPYVESEYASWWPLHYNLAEIYRALGHIPEAIEGHRRVLELFPSNIESNKALAELYAAAGERELSEKFRRKSEML